MPAPNFGPAFFYPVVSKMPNETLDSLTIGRLQLMQAEKGYRYSLDPILLTGFVRVKHWNRIVDLGTGCGIIPLLMAKKSDADELIGIELQPDLADRARRNVVLNSMQERVKIQQGDVRSVERFLPAKHADLVLCNPPYRAIGSGRIAPDDERAIARHELAGGLGEFIAAAAWLLKNRGTFAIIHLAERLPQVIEQMIKKGIEPKRLRCVHSYPGADARLVLLEGRKGARPGLQIEPPLFIYQQQGATRNYSEELLRLYALDSVGAD